MGGAVTVEREQRHPLDGLAIAFSFIFLRLCLCADLNCVVLHFASLLCRPELLTELVKQEMPPMPLCDAGSFFLTACDTSILCVRVWVCVYSVGW